MAALKSRYFFIIYINKNKFLVNKKIIQYLDDFTLVGMTGIEPVRGLTLAGF